ncbi:MAG: PIN domain-containing protein [Planctomycetes bacterium]|nr:PIN domain-containing protein [Planctomycetota bacterium]
MIEGRVIADTGPLAAFLVKEDAHHAWSVERFKELQAPFLTCEPVLTETFHLVRRLRGGEKRFFELLETDLLMINFNLLDSLKELKKLILKYADLPMSLADACIVRLAEMHPKSVVFTLDGHFRLFRAHDRKPIPLILPPDR